MEVRLSYSVALSDNRLRTGVSARDVRLCNAFATLCAHDGESFRHDAYGAIGDPFVSACASWEVHLRAPTSLVAAGPGLVSASEGSWTFSGENLRDFALVLSPDFCVAQGEVDGVTVRSFAFDQEGGAAGARLRDARALRLWRPLWRLSLPGLHGLRRGVLSRRHGVPRPRPGERRAI